MKAELKNVKIAEFLSEETTAFTATLYIDGKKAAEVRNNGRGGANSILALEGKRDIVREFEEWAEALPPHRMDGENPDDIGVSKYGEIPMSGEFYIDLLLSKYQEEKQINGWCRNKIVLQHKDAPDDQYETIGQKFTVALVPALQARYPDYEIVNLRFV